MPFNMFEVDMSSLNISLKKIAKDVVARDGIEPPTQAFSGLCSTDSRYVVSVESIFLIFKR